MSHEKDVKISINIPNEMYEWLEKHKEINRSELFRNSVELVKNPIYEKFSDVFVLNVSVILSGVVGFMMLLMTPFIEHLFILLTWVVLASIVLMCTMYVVVKRLKGINNGKEI